MKLINRWAAPLALAIATAPAAAQPAAPPTVTAADSAAVDLAIQRGALMYAYDQAAWHGTDDLNERLKAAGSYDRVAPTIGGWVVEGPAAAPVVTFFDRDEARPRALYRATMTDGGRRIASAALVPGEAVTPAQLAMIKALRVGRERLVADKLGFCNDRMPNSVVLPPQKAGDPTLVYFLTPQTDASVFPLGGHYRMDVAPDGTVVAVRPFMKSCLPLDRKKASELNGGKGSETMVVSHLLDPTPTEVHVFTAIAAQTAIGVVTDQQRLWMVAPGDGHVRITPVTLGARK